MMKNHTSSLTSDSVERLREYAVLVRKTMLEMYDTIGCLSGAFSAVELYVALYLHHLDTDLIVASDDARARVLAKGTSSLAFYATLSAAGIMEQGRLKHYGTEKLPLMYYATNVGVDATHYTLGPSLGTAAGFALASKLKGVPYDVVCFMGDGELQEHVDQAAKCAANLGLGNLAVVVDCNGQQSYYFTEVGDPTMAEGPTGQLDRQRAFWEACGWRVLEIDGHRFEEILDAYGQIGKDDRPLIILARTVKGKGIESIEGVLGHQHAMSPEALQHARESYAAETRRISVRLKDVQPPPKKRRFAAPAAPQVGRPCGTMRKTFADWVHRLKTDNRGLVFSLDSDCVNIFGSQGPETTVSRTTYEAQHIFPGLNERLTLTMAKGLAYEGLYPVVGSRANNLTDTSEEWNAICVDRLPVLLAGTRPGAVQADWGPDKCSFVDIDMLARPGALVLQPSNSLDLIWLMETLYARPQEHLPAYLRIPDFENETDTHARDGERSWENGYYVCCGACHTEDYAAIIATGDSLKEVLAVDRLHGRDNRIKVLNLFNLTRIDAASIQKDMRGARKIISVVEARSGAISELVFTSLTPGQRSVYEPLGIQTAVAVPDKTVFAEEGFYGARDYVLRCRGRDADSLARRLGLVT